MQCFYHIYPNYCSYRLYPLSTKKYVDTKVRSTTSKGELAIVLQGIVAIQDDCTLETVRLYKKIFRVLLLFSVRGTLLPMSCCKNSERKGVRSFSARHLSPVGLAMSIIRYIHLCKVLDELRS